VGARTVYRYFPAQADLFEALWAQVRKRSGTVFPITETEIVAKLGALYRAFDENEKLVRASALVEPRKAGPVSSRACEK